MGIPDIAFFFHCLAAPALAAHPLRVNVAAEQLATPPGHGVHVQPQQVGDFPIPPMAEFLRLEPGI